MGIDPLTLVAQIINLFILVWILKRFLYHPILAIIDKRKNEIIKMNEQALCLKKEAEKYLAEIQKKQEDFDKVSQKEQAKLHTDLKKEQETARFKLKQDISLLRQRLYNDLKSEEEYIKKETYQFISQDFLKLAEKILTDLTGSAPFERVFSLFLDEFSKLRKNDKIKFNNSIKKQKLITINSSKELTNNQQKIITDLLKKEFVLPLKCKILFSCQKDLILGIELRVGTLSIDWSIKNYLEDLHMNMNNMLLNQEEIKE